MLNFLHGGKIHFFCKIKSPAGAGSSVEALILDEVVVLRAGDDPLEEFLEGSVLFRPVDRPGRAARD